MPRFIRRRRHRAGRGHADRIREERRVGPARSCPPSRGERDALRCSPASSPRSAPSAAITPIGGGDDMRLVDRRALARHRDDRARRLDRLLRLLPDRGRKSAPTGSPPMPRPRRSASTTLGRWQRRHAGQPGTLAAARRRTRRAYRVRPCRWRRRGAVGHARARLHPLALPRPARPRPLHRGEGQRRRRRRVVDGERGDGRYFRREHHPAHRRGDRLRHACGRATRSISRSTCWPAMSPGWRSSR